MTNPNPSLEVMWQY